MKIEKDFSKYTFNETSFQFANKDAKLSDEKLKTKPTSFAKDSFRRFCKNKSSVVAAFILGIIILLAIFVPIITGVDTETVSANEAFLLPKLFKTGTGFWDGTQKYVKKYNLDGSPTGIMYDFENECPAGFYMPAVSDLKIDSEPSFINQASIYGKGGYLIFENQAADGIVIDTLKSDENGLKITAADHYSVTIVLSDEENALNEKLGEYRIYFTNLDETTTLPLKDWSKQYGTLTLDLSQALTDAGLTELTGRLVFELKSIEGSYTYILIESCVFSADDGVDNLQSMQDVGFSDATSTVLITKYQQDTGEIETIVNPGYWECTGRKGVYKSEVYYCEFVFDTYAKAYDVKESQYAWSKMKVLIQQGLCKYDYNVGPSSFQLLSDDCPVKGVVAQYDDEFTGKPMELTVELSRYQDLGYKKMPKFLLGTDSKGVDVLTTMFAGLRTSLILGVCTFLFCFLFGLVWGAISGYFGGWVDLAMERFCDILGGVPWIVVMTLCILHLGNNFFTFFLALCMTGWMGTAGGTRTQFYRFKRMEYVLASRTLGSSDIRLIFKHILPNSLGTIITSSVLMIPGVIFSEATISYLGLGLRGIASFGVLLSENQQYLQSQSYLVICPAVVMALLMISFNLFGNGLRDAVNPTLKGAN